MLFNQYIVSSSASLSSRTGIFSSLYNNQSQLTLYPQLPIYLPYPINFSYGSQSTLLQFYAFFIIFYPIIFLKLQLQTIYKVDPEMHKKCHHIHQKRSQAPMQQNLKESKSSYIRTQYGLAKFVEPERIIIHNDAYMLQEMHHTNKKIKSMEKQIKRLKSRLKKCERNAKCEHNENDDILKSIQYIRKSRMGTYSNDHSSSRTETVSNSRKRQIGRFTRLTDRESIQSSNDQESGMQQTKVKTHSKAKAKNQGPPELLKSCKSKQSALQYSQDDEEVITKYLPRGQEYISKKSSLLLSKNFQDEYSGYEKQRLNHQLQQLIIEQKNTNNPVEKRTIRKQIGVISKKLASLQPDFA